MRENVMDYFMKRAWPCKRNRQGHINDIVFIINAKPFAIE